MHLDDIELIQGMNLTFQHNILQLCVIHISAAPQILRAYEE